MRRLSLLAPITCLVVVLFVHTILTLASDAPANEFLVRTSVPSSHTLVTQTTTPNGHMFTDWATAALATTTLDREQLQINPNPPERTLKFVFLHASVGEHWTNYALAGREDHLEYLKPFGLKANNYNVRDYSVHNHHDSYSDIYKNNNCHWYDIFYDSLNTPFSPAKLNILFNHNAVEGNYNPIDPGDTSENDIIMIKPCYTNYPYPGNPDDPPSGVHDCSHSGLRSVGNVKQELIDILEITRQHPDKFFVFLTAPPVLYSTWSSDPVGYGSNPRAVASWMVNELLQDYDGNNVMVYDLFNVLTSSGHMNPDFTCPWCYEEEGVEHCSDVLLSTGNHHRVWNGQVQHQQDVDRNYSAYCANYPGAPGYYKMTTEFVPVLNVYVNAWLAGEPLPTGTPTPTPTLTPTPTPTLTTSPTPTATFTPTPTATPCVLFGDFDGDGDVDFDDIMLVASRWNTAVGDADYDPTYDLDDDGDIDIVDIMLVAIHWGETC